MLRNLFLITICSLFLLGCSNNDWRSTTRASAGIAPDPKTTPEAVLQVYGADVYGWRGIFAIHTWISVKPANADRYTVYEVVGWRTRRGLPALSIRQDLPDRHWFGAEPELLLDHRGEKAERLITEVDSAARRYPWAMEYTLFPGPNSNTFPAWIAREVPELELDLPFSAIGKGYTGS